jgi:hypothetical protein
MSSNNDDLQPARFRSAALNQARILYPHATIAELLHIVQQDDDDAAAAAAAAAAAPFDDSHLSPDPYPGDPLTLNRIRVDRLRYSGMGRPACLRLLSASGGVDAYLSAPPTPAELLELARDRQQRLERRWGAWQGAAAAAASSGAAAAAAASSGAAAVANYAYDMGGYDEAEEYDEAAEYDETEASCDDGAAVSYNHGAAAAAASYNHGAAAAAAAPGGRIPRAAAIKAAQQIASSSASAAAAAGGGAALINAFAFGEPTARQLADRAATEIIPFAEVSPDRPKPNKKGVRVMPAQQCTADDDDTGVQCTIMTARGNHCDKHMRSIDHVYLDKSTIPGAGLGLFAAQRGEHTKFTFKFNARTDKGDVVALYTGDTVALPEDEGEGVGIYTLDVGNDIGVDAARTNTGYARWTNASDYHIDGVKVEGGPKPNVKLDWTDNDAKLGIIAIANIRPGEELFTNYGKTYFNPDEDPKEEDEERDDPSYNPKKRTTGSTKKREGEHRAAAAAAASSSSSSSSSNTRMRRNMVASSAASASAASLARSIRSIDHYATHHWWLEPTTPTSSAIADLMREVGTMALAELTEEQWMGLAGDARQLPINEPDDSFSKPLRSAMSKLTHATEAFCRPRLKTLLGKSYDNKLALVAVKLLLQHKGEGRQKLHYDVPGKEKSATRHSFLIYGSDNRSTRLPVLDANAMDALHLTDEQEGDPDATEERRVALTNKENFISTPVNAGDCAAFRADVLHAGVKNKRNADRVVLYALYSPSMETKQDDEQIYPLGVPGSKGNENGSSSDDDDIEEDEDEEDE